VINVYWTKKYRTFFLSELFYIRLCPSVSIEIVKTLVYFYLKCFIIKVSISKIFNQIQLTCIKNIFNEKILATSSDSYSIYLKIKSLNGFFMVY